MLELKSDKVLYAAGKVVHGFGRGSKQLGIPTANMEDSVVEKLPESFHSGVYFGWAKVDHGPVTKAVVSIGFNPYFKNTKRTLETHLMHTNCEDFYDSLHQVLLIKYHRPQLDFNGLDDLIACIKDDIAQADRYLDEPEARKWKDDPCFTTCPLLK